MTPRFYIAWWFSAVFLLAVYTAVGLHFQGRLLADHEAAAREKLAREKQRKEALAGLGHSSDAVKELDGEMKRASRREAMLGLARQRLTGANREIDQKAGELARRDARELSNWAARQKGWEARPNELKTAQRKADSAWAECSSRYKVKASQQLEAEAEEAARGPDEAKSRELLAKAMDTAVEALLSELEKEAPTEMRQVQLEMLVGHEVGVLRAYVESDLARGTAGKEIIDDAVKEAGDGLEKWNEGLSMKRFDPEELKQARAALARQGEALRGERVLALLSGDIEDARSRMLEAARKASGDEAAHDAAESVGKAARAELAASLKKKAAEAFEQTVKALRAKGPAPAGRVLVLVVGMQGLAGEAKLLDALKQFDKDVSPLAGGITWAVVTHTTGHRWAPDRKVPFEADALCPPKRFADALEKALKWREARSGTGDADGPATLIVWPSAQKPEALYERTPLISVPDRGRVFLYWVGPEKDATSDWLKGTFKQKDQGYDPVPPDDVKKLAERMKARLREWKALGGAKGGGDGR
jgi:hypothetical protein